MGIKYLPTCFPFLATYQGNRLPIPIQWGVGTTSMQWTRISPLAHEKAHPEMGATCPESHTGIYFPGRTDLSEPGNKGRESRPFLESHLDLGLQASGSEEED